MGATGILSCLDGATGQPHWRVDVLQLLQQPNAPFGMCGSPLVTDDWVIVAPGGSGHCLAAFSRSDGELIWVGGEGDASYSSPMLATIAGQQQVICFHGDGISGVDFQTGEQRWSFPWVTNPPEKNNVCQPIVLPTKDALSSQIFIASGYGEGCALMDVVFHNEVFAVQERWSNLNLKAKFSSAVRNGEYVYGLDNRMLVCVRLSDGKRMWKGGRYGYGQVLRVGNAILVQAESGNVMLVAADETRHRELARLDALSSRTWNQPVVSGQWLLVRNDREAACYRIKFHDLTNTSEVPARTTRLGVDILDH